MYFILHWSASLWDFKFQIFKGNNFHKFVYFNIFTYYYKKHILRSQSLDFVPTFQEWSLGQSTKFVHSCITRSWSQELGFQNAIFKILLDCLKPESLESSYLVYKYNIHMRIVVWFSTLMTSGNDGVKRNWNDVKIFARFINACQVRDALCRGKYFF